MVHLIDFVFVGAINNALAQVFRILPELRDYFLLFQVTDMMVANSHNLIVTVKPANQRNNVVHRGSKTSMGNSGSVGSAGSTGSAPSHDSPSPASQSNLITARYDMDRPALQLLFKKTKYFHRAKICTHLQKEHLHAGKLA